MPLRRLAIIVLVAAALAACDRITEAARGADAPIDDSGAYILLELDMATFAEERLVAASDAMAEALRGASPSIRYSARGVANNAARITLTEPANSARALQTLQALGTDFVFTDDGTGVIEARLTQEALSEDTAPLQELSVDVLQRRAEMFRLSVAAHGDDQIIVRSPDAAFPERARVALTTRAQISFHMVRELTPQEAAAGRVPAGFMMVQPYPGAGSSIEVVAERPSISGERIENARPSVDRSGGFVIAFEFDREGARQFCTITTQSVNQRFAVLFDDQVISAPMILEPICGGNSQISGNFTAEFANELATLMRAGGLPAPVTIVAQGIGPLVSAP